MKNMIVTAFKLFRRNKAFLFSVTIIPTLLFLLMTVLLPYTEMHSVSVINHTDDKAIENSINGIDGINIVEANEDKIAELISRGTIELAVVINEDPETGFAVAQIYNSGDSEIYDAVELAVSYASDSSQNSITSVNSSDRGIHNLMNTLPFMLYKFIEGASVLGAMMIADRKKHIKDRIMLSGISPVTYISGMTMVYFICSCFGSGLYCLVGGIMSYDFGMRYPIHYFIMLCFVNLFSASFYVLAASLVNSEESLQGVSTLVLVSAFFSGMLFPFDYMPKVFKMIGNCCPQRWIVKGIENIQVSGTFSAALPQIGLVFTLTLIFLIIGVYGNCKKTASLWHY
ncbi:MAG: ABC transporter permease [Lachnospiraceae bacterium]